MKLILAMVLALLCAACGDTINNAAPVTTSTTTSPTGGTTSGLPTFDNTTSHAPATAGAAAYIPADTFCTSKMNEIFNTEGKPDTIDITDGPGVHFHTWRYATPAVRSVYYFNWRDIGFYTTFTIPPEACGFDFYKAYTITP